MFVSIQVLNIWLHSPHVTPQSLAVFHTYYAYSLQWFGENKIIFLININKQNYMLST